MEITREASPEVQDESIQPIHDGYPAEEESDEQEPQAESEIAAEPGITLVGDDVKILWNKYRDF